MSTTRSTQQPHRIDARSLLVPIRYSSHPTSLDAARAAQQFTEQGISVTRLGVARDRLAGGTYGVDPQAVNDHYVRTFDVGFAVLFGLVPLGVLVGITSLTQTGSITGADDPFAATAQLFGWIRWLLMVLWLLVAIGITVAAAYRGAPFRAKTRRHNLAAAILESCCIRAGADR